MNRREQRLAQRAAEREAAKKIQAVKPDAVADNVAGREAQKDDYMAGLARDKAAREQSKLEEARLQKAAENDFAARFAAPQSIVAGNDREPFPRGRKVLRGVV